MGVYVFKSMIGVTMKSIVGDKGDERMTFTGEDGREWVFYYAHDCCASCNIEDICGDLADLIGSPIVEAEEVDNAEPPMPERQYGPPDSYTWSFFRFATAKGSVVVRWFGESNGYYSESVTYVGPEGERSSWQRERAEATP